MGNYKSLNLLKVINLFAFIIVIVVNALANILPINGMNTGELSGLYPNLFVPAGYTFSIWGVIYFFLAIFVIYQLGIFFISRNIKIDINKDISWLFIISCIANASWIFFWHYRLLWLSIIAMLTILFSLILIYIRIDKYKEISIWEKICIKVPFSIYLAWITVATIANVTTLLVSLKWNGFGLSQEFWTILMIIVATILTSIILVSRNNIVYGLVIIWSLTGILVKHITTFMGNYKGIIITIGICILIILITIAARYRKKTIY